MPQLTNKTKPHLGLHILLISQFSVLQNSRNKHRGKQTKAKKKVHHCLPTISGTMLSEYCKSGEARPVECLGEKPKKHSFQFLHFSVSATVQGELFRFYQQTDCSPRRRKEKSILYTERSVCTPSLFDCEKNPPKVHLLNERKAKMKSM